MRYSIYSLIPLHFYRKGHYGVFGCNFFATKKDYVFNESLNGQNPATQKVFLDKEMIFGDEDCMEQWSEMNYHPNCADKGWVCFGAISEFDYLFVCVDEQSSDFGATRYIVNNCHIDKELTNAPFDNFFHKIPLALHNPKSLIHSEYENISDLSDGSNSSSSTEGEI